MPSGIHHLETRHHPSTRPRRDRRGRQAIDVAERAGVVVPSTRPRRDRRGRPRAAATASPVPASLQRGLGEIAEEDTAPRRATRRRCRPFNEASARSPRKTRTPGSLSAQAALPSTRPRRDRRGRPDHLSRVASRSNALQRGLGEIAEEDARPASPPGADQRILQRGLGEIAEEDGSHSLQRYETLFPSTRPRRDRRGRRRRAAPGPPGSTAFNEASARSPRKTSVSATATPRRRSFNEASARSPRKTDGETRRVQLEVTLQRGLGKIAEEDGSDCTLLVCAAHVLQRGLGEIAEEDRGVLIIACTMDLSLQRGLGEIAEEDGQGDQRLGGGEPPSTRPRRDRRGRPLRRGRLRHLAARPSTRPRRDRRGRLGG